MPMAPRKNPWREAVVEALVSNLVYNEAKHGANPVKALNDLIDWEIKIALDPAVSYEARQLVARFSDELQKWKSGDWCDVCNAPQMVLPDGEHRCLTLPSLHSAYDEKCKKEEELAKELRRAAAMVSELQFRLKTGGG